MGFAPCALDTQKNEYVGNPVKLGQIVLTPNGCRIEYETIVLARELARSKITDSREAKWLETHGYRINTEKLIRVWLSHALQTTAKSAPKAA